jgi:hypothetical protein
MPININGLPLGMKTIENGQELYYSMEKGLVQDFPIFKKINYSLSPKKNAILGLGQVKLFKV